MKQKTTLGLFALGIVAILGISLVAAYQGDPNVQGPNYSEDHHEAMQDAFEAGDYDAWVILMTEDGRHPKIVDVITKDNFDDFVEARTTGPEAFRDFRKSLGLGLGQMKHGDGSGQGQKRGPGNRQCNCPLTE